jgi:hypothetical protein
MRTTTIRTITTACFAAVLGTALGTTGLALADDMATRTRPRPCPRRRRPPSTRWARTRPSPPSPPRRRLPGQGPLRLLHGHGRRHALPRRQAGAGGQEPARLRQVRRYAVQEHDRRRPGLRRGLGGLQWPYPGTDEVRAKTSYVMTNDGGFFCGVGAEPLYNHPIAVATAESCIALGTGGTAVAFRRPGQAIVSRPVALPGRPSRSRPSSTRSPSRAASSSPRSNLPTAVAIVGIFARRVVVVQQ